MKVNMQLLKAHFKSIALALMLIFAACTPQKRLAGLIKKHPELVQSDKVIDTAKGRGFSIDTAFLMLPGDTVVIYRDNFIEKIIRDTANGFKVAADKKPDKIPFVKTVNNVQPPAPAEKKNKQKIPTWVQYLLAGIGILFLLKLLLQK